MTARRRPPWSVLVLAAAFVAYWVLLVHCDIVRPEAYGFHADFAGGPMVLSRIAPDSDSPAVRAGLFAGDVITAADGRAIRSVGDWELVEDNLTFGRPIHLTVHRRGDTLDRPLVLARARWTYWTTSAGVVMAGVLGVQLVAMSLAIVIVLRRPDDPLALLGAWALATAGVYTIVPPYRIAAVWRGLPFALGALMWVPYLSSQAVGAVLFTFFTHFPRRLIHSARVSAAAWVPMALALMPPTRDTVLRIYQPAQATPAPHSGTLLMAATGAYLLAGLGTLVLTYRRLDDVNERRRTKIVVVGAVAGLLPGLIAVAAYQLRRDADVSASIFTSRTALLGTMSLLLFPASLAYAILRRNLFDLPLMIRQGVRYAVARGLLVSVVPALALLLVIDVLLRGNQPLAVILETRASVYAVMAGLAVAAHSRRHQWLQHLDRRFFREQYNAQQLLRRVADEVRHGGDFERVAPRVVAHIAAALHPEFVALLVRTPNDLRYGSLVAAPAGLAPPPLRVDSRIVALLRVLGTPIEVSGTARWLAQQVPHEELDLLQQGRIELLVPIVTTPEHAQSILTLGVKRSEEPYTQEDRDLLAIIADNLALLLERPVRPTSHVHPTYGECPECGTCFDAGVLQCQHDGVMLAPVPLPRLLAMRYRLDRRVGRGGCGTVYEARDTALDRRVAVKMIRDDLLTRADIAARFQREAKLAAGFMHPNVVTVHDFGAVSARAFLVMEFLDGTTLRDALVRELRFGPSRALAVMRDVCAAMDVAHRQRLIHRDLKPENIFLVSDGSKEIAKVLDFGVARALNDARDIVTDVGALVGTLRYMAPAQLRGEEVEPASDIWALGVIAYEMLTGAHPFTHMPTGPVADMPADHSAAIAVPLGDAPGTWTAFFERALAPEAERRPSTPAAFLAELESALANAAA